MGAYEEIKCRRSIVTDTLQSLTEQVALWRENLDRVEAGQKLDLADAIGQLTRLLDTGQNLRDAVLSEDSSAKWTTKAELHALIGRLDDAASKRRRYLDLSQLLSSGTVTHRRERTRQERLRLRDAAVNELMETSALPSPPDLPGPAPDMWLEWACNLDDSSNDPDLVKLKMEFPHLDDFVRQLEIESWENGTSTATHRTVTPEPEIPEVEIAPAKPVKEKKKAREEKSFIEEFEKKVVEHGAKAAPALTETIVLPPTVEPEPLAPSSSSTSSNGKLCFLPADEVGAFARALNRSKGEPKDEREIQALVAVSHWLAPEDQNPLMHPNCGIRTQIGYAGTSDLLPVSPDEAKEAIEAENDLLLFTGGADLLRWAIAENSEGRRCAIASVRRLRANQLKAWFSEVFKIELAEPQVQDIYRLTQGIPMLVGELHRLIIPDPKAPPTWLGFALWTNIKSSFERRIPVMARELRNGPPTLRLSEREIRVLKMVMIASDDSTPETIEQNLTKDWDEYHRPEIEALGSADEGSVELLQDLGMLPAKRDFGLTPIKAMLPLEPGDAIRQVISHL